MGLICIAESTAKTGSFMNAEEDQCSKGCRIDLRKAADVNVDCMWCREGCEAQNVDEYGQTFDECCCIPYMLEISCRCAASSALRRRIKPNNQSKFHA